MVSGRNGERPGFMERLSIWATESSGRSETVVVAVLALLVWGLTGPYFHYSNTWQLVANTATSLVTFLMVFLIQRSQNKASMALQLKLNEIIAAVRGASNRMISIEELSEDDLRRLHARYLELAARTGASTVTKTTVEAVEPQPGKQALPNG